MFKVKANTASDSHVVREYNYTAIGLKSAIGLIALSLSFGLLIPGVYAGCACSVGNWTRAGF